MSVHLFSVLLSSILLTIVYTLFVTHSLHASIYKKGFSSVPHNKNVDKISSAPNQDFQSFTK